jgi:peptide/nickel transport system permease protein
VTVYLAQRVGTGLLTILGIILLTFMLIRISGDPTAMLVPLDAPPGEADRIRQLYGLNEPGYVQLVKYFDQVLHFDFGRSMRYRSDVVTLLGMTIPNTLLLVGAALAWTLLTGIPLGIAAALRPNSRFDKAVNVLAGIFQSTPNFVMALLLLTFIALGLGWFPVAGFDQPKSIVLPALALGAAPFAALVRLVRDETIVVLTSEYVAYARAKGLQQRTIWTRHVVRNALAPAAGLTYVLLARMVAGTVVLESIFNWPGVGKLFFEAASSRDYWIVQAFVIYTGVAVVIINLAAEFLNSWLDPRLRLGGR